MIVPCSFKEAYFNISVRMKDGRVIDYVLVEKL